MQWLVTALGVRLAQRTEWKGRLRKRLRMFAERCTIQDGTEALSARVARRSRTNRALTGGETGVCSSYS